MYDVSLVRCPVCRARLRRNHVLECEVCGEIEAVQGVPVLVDFENSILDRD